MERDQLQEISMGEDEFDDDEGCENDCSTCPDATCPNNINANVAVYFQQELIRKVPGYRHWSKGMTYNYN